MLGYETLQQQKEVIVITRLKILYGDHVLAFASECDCEMIKFINN